MSPNEQNQEFVSMRQRAIDDLTSDYRSRGMYAAGPHAGEACFNPQTNIDIIIGPSFLAKPWLSYIAQGRGEQRAFSEPPDAYNEQMNDFKTTLDAFLSEETEWYIAEETSTPPNKYSRGKNQKTVRLEHLTGHKIRIAYTDKELFSQDIRSMRTYVFFSTNNEEQETPKK